MLYLKPKNTFLKREKKGGNSNETGNTFRF